MRKYSVRGGNGKALVAKDGKIYVGLDVHKRTVSVAVAQAGAIVGTWTTPMDVPAVVAALSVWGGQLALIVYEAGPTGYGLARALRRARLPVEVVAPGKTPRPANRGAKSDRLDCGELAVLAEKGLLRAVAVPTAQQEADRQVVRLRHELTDKQRRVKQQIKSLLLAYGLAEPPGLRDWTKEGVAALRTCALGRQLRLVLDTLLGELEQLLAWREQVDQALKRQAGERRLAVGVRRLDGHPGVGPLTAMTFAAEVYQPRRFANGRQVTSYVGLAPRVEQSGETRRGGPLIPAGRGRLRALLVEAAWRWVAADPAAAATYGRLRRNTGRGQKAIVGMARRLAVHLWVMLSRRQDYRPATGGPGDRTAPLGCDGAAATSRGAAHSRRAADPSDAVLARGGRKS